MDILGRPGERTLLRALLLILAAALIWVGVGFAGYAIYVAFLASLEPLWAAAMTAACLLAIPAVTLIVLGFRRPRAALYAPELRPVQADADNATLALLANLAKERPLLAVLIAGILGAAETLRRRQP